MPWRSPTSIAAHAQPLQSWSCREHSQLALLEAGSLDAREKTRTAPSAKMTAGDKQHGVDGNGVNISDSFDDSGESSEAAGTSCC